MCDSSEGCSSSVEKFYAHSGNQGGYWETAAEHLSAVSNRAHDYALPLGLGEQAELCGLLHDIGKYADQFKLRLQSPNRVASKDHWSAGAAWTAQIYKDKGVFPAAAIQGHHIGLQMLEASSEKFVKRIAKHVRDQPDSWTETDLSLLKRRFETDGFYFPQLSDDAAKPSPVLQCDNMLDTRLLFSCLVDADFIETEAHFDGDADSPRRYRPEGPSLNAVTAWERLERHLYALAKEKIGPETINRTRQRLLADCLTAAEAPQGLFTLSAPTGSGKTLATLAFALRHAIQHNLRRIIVVLPFLNIIDQTARTYRALFSVREGFDPHCVLEDHSLADQQEGTTDDGLNESLRLRRMLAQNWDAPIILTSNVKCLESLLSHRASACRKLHRMAESIILFDEVQTLPRSLVLPTLATLSRLSKRYSTSIVFATATQPAFGHFHKIISKLTPAGWAPKEIVGKPEQLFENTSKRVQVRWRHGERILLPDLANEVAQHEQIMCIVNTKNNAADLTRLLWERKNKDVLHLSTNMCPAHRQAVLDSTIERLNNKQPIRLVSTQCVEAGVDISFPAVYRALAPLESIAQAAGRCNRHGEMSTPGEVVVFEPVDAQGKTSYPPGYKQPVAATRTFLNSLSREHGCLDDLNIIQHPERLRRYFRDLYKLTGAGEGVSTKEREILEAIKAMNFEIVSKEYRLIDQDTINVLVSYDESTFQGLREEIDELEYPQPGQIRQWLTRARPFTVGLRRPTDKNDPAWTYLEPIQFGRRNRATQQDSDWFVLLKPECYDRKLLGFLKPEGERRWIS